MISNEQFTSMRSMGDASYMTDRSRLILAIAEQRAKDLQSATIAPEHLLFALAAESNGLAASVLRNLGDQSNFIQNALLAGRIATLEGATYQLPYDDATNRIIAAAAAETTRLQHNYIGTEHLLLGLCSVAPDLFMRIGINPDEVRSEVHSILGHGLLR